MAAGLHRHRQHPSQVSNLSSLLIAIIPIILQTYLLLIPIIPTILQTYLPYLSQLFQLSSIFFPTYPLHAYVADK
jgi:hypothetical protein